MGLRDRRDKRHEERETFGRGGTAQRFQMRQKLVSFGDDYWIQNGDGERIFRVDGKAMRLRNTLDLEDAHGPTCAASRLGSCTYATPWRWRIPLASSWPSCTRR